jgi:hypothetical protein
MSLWFITSHLSLPKAVISENILLVANEIPELKELYSPDIPNYDYVEWSNALNVFLGCRFTNWAGRNRMVWGNSEGRRMFSDITAFGKERWDVLNHNDIIVFLRGVYERWIEKKIVIMNIKAV